MSDPSSESHLHSALAGLAPPIALDDKWNRIQARTAHRRRSRRLRIGACVICGLGALSLAVIWACGAIRSPNPVLVIGDDLTDATMTAAAFCDVAEELRQAWRDEFLEGLWSGNVDTIPARPASLPPEFWEEPANPLEIPSNLDPSFTEGKPLWIFANELALQEVLSAFQRESARRPVVVLAPPAELLDRVGATTHQGQELEPQLMREAAAGHFVLLRLPDLGWQVMRVASSDSTLVPSSVSWQRETYEDMARTTMVELRSYAQGDLLNADLEGGDPDRQGTVVFRGTWGDGLGQFARVSTSDVSGSYDVAVGPKGYLFVLDPLAKKVQVVSPEGQALLQIPLRAERPTHVAVSTAATIFVNDADGSGQVQAYGIDAEFLGSVSARQADSEVVGLAGVCIGGYGGVWAEVGDEDGETSFANVYRFDHPATVLDDTLPLGASGSAVVATQPLTLKSPFSPLNPTQLAPLGLSWWGSVLGGEDAPYVSVFGPRGPFEAPLHLEEGWTLEKADVVGLVKSLNGDSRDCRVMVSAVVRDVDENLVRVVWLFDNQGVLIERAALGGLASMENPQEVAACASFDGCLYVLRVGQGGATIVRYKVV